MASNIHFDVLFSPNFLETISSIICSISFFEKFLLNSNGQREVVLFDSSSFIITVTSLLLSNEGYNHKCGAFVGLINRCFQSFRMLKLNKFL